MKPSIQFGVALTLLLSASIYCRAQAPATNGPIILTADSLASGNYKDVLSSFYQLAVTNLTGPAKELKFTSNPYAIMLRGDSTLAIDRNYQRLRFWRSLNFTVDAKLDSSSHFNGWSIGLTYAIINKRDITVSKAFERLAKNDPNDAAYAKLLNVTAVFIASTFDPRDSLLKDTYLAQLKRAAEDSTLTFNNLDSSLQKIIKNIITTDSSYSIVAAALAKNPKLNVYTERNKGFNALVKSFQNKPLWTAGVSDTTYSDGYFSKAVALTTEFLKGVVNADARVNLELDFKAALNFTDDTLQSGRNLGRQIFNFQPGVNLVLKGKKSRQPYLEFKLSGGYSNIWKGALYAKEEQITNTINGTLNIRVFKNIWIPLALKYDTKTHNVFGFLNVTTNFTALGSLFKGSKS